MARRKSAVERRQEVDGWRASGLSAVAYAAGRGYSAGTLRIWAADLALEEPKFVRLELATPQPAELTVEIAGARVLLRRGFDAALLRDVVAALSEESR